MLERCCQMADALSRHLARAAAAKGDAAKAAAAAAVGRDALLAGIHYFRIRDHVEQVGGHCVVFIVHAAEQKGRVLRGASCMAHTLRRHPNHCLAPQSALLPAAHPPPCSLLPSPLPCPLQLAAVELMPGFLEAHPAVKLVVIDSVTFHFRQVRQLGVRPADPLGPAIMHTSPCRVARPSPPAGLCRHGGTHAPAGGHGAASHGAGGGARRGGALCALRGGGSWWASFGRGCCCCCT